MDIRFIIIIVIIFSLMSIFFIFLYNKKHEDIPLASKYLDIKSTTSLKVNYIEGLKYCESFEFSSAFEFEVCTWNYIQNKSNIDSKVLDTIKNYCNDNSSNEFDRRECIDDIIKLD